MQMNKAPSALQALAQALQRLPGVGEKTAHRMAWHFLQHDREGALLLARSLTQACELVGHCSRCNTLSQLPVCDVCSDPNRDSSVLCVVESSSDQDMIEKTGLYHGLYFVLSGAVKPLDGVGVQSSGLTQLIARIQQNSADISVSAATLSTSAPSTPVKELVIATSFTASGEVTAHAVAQAVKGLDLRVTRLSKGVPAGSELEYVDLSSLAHSLSERKPLS